ncbi:MAG: hypothetical protein ABIH89_02150 [Elusimicrobiota bacterium]
MAYIEKLLPAVFLSIFFAISVSSADPEYADAVTDASEHISLPGYKTCSYARSIVKSSNVETPGNALGEPDSAVAFIGVSTGSVLLLDMGEFKDGEGYDIIYYELWGDDKGKDSNPGILLDNVRIDITYSIPENNPENADWKTVFIWGDDNDNNNGTIGTRYLIHGEITNTSILCPDLYAGADLDGNGSVDISDGSGILIDIGSNNGNIWRYVMIRRFPQGKTVDDKGDMSEIDAIAVCHPVPRKLNP